MTTLDALLAAVIAEPGDDAPRLVMADWLEEQGDDLRARYIRVRIEWDNLLDCGHDWLLAPGGLKCPTCRRKDELRAAGTSGDGLPFWERAFSDWGKPFRAMEEVTWRRGFVSEVRCTLAAWCGGECRRCEGRGLIYDDGNGRGTQYCVVCDGTGRTPAHGPAIVRAAPVTRVVLNNLKPGRAAEDYGDYPWYWEEEGTISGEWVIPVQLWECLQGYSAQGFRRAYARIDPRTKGARQRLYTTEAAALDALSDAALRWAKGQTIERSDP